MMGPEKVQPRESASQETMRIRQGWQMRELLEVFASKSVALKWSMHVFTGLVEGKIYGKAPYFMGKPMVSCRSSRKPSH